MRLWKEYIYGTKNSGKRENASNYIRVDLPSKHLDEVESKTSNILTKRHLWRKQ